MQSSKLPAAPCILVEVFMGIDASLNQVQHDRYDAIGQASKRLPFTIGCPYLLVDITTPCCQASHDNKCTISEHLLWSSLTRKAGQCTVRIVLHDFGSSLDCAHGLWYLKTNTRTLNHMCVWHLFWCQPAYFLAGWHIYPGVRSDTETYSYPDICSDMKAVKLRACVLMHGLTHMFLNLLWLLII